MRDSVRNAFSAFSAAYEGCLPFLYADIKGLVTTSIGVLVDPVDAALTLPWVRPDGTPATQNEIKTAWRDVKARTDLTQRGGTAYRNVTTIRLTAEGIDLAVQQKLKLFDSQMRARFPDFEDYPADAQLGLLSMCWAMGGGFGFPIFGGHVMDRSFDLAAENCKMDERGNPGLIPRNKANKILFNNAAIVLARKLDPAKLYWPQDLELLEASQPAVNLTESIPPDSDPDFIPKSDGIFEAVSQSIAQYRKERDEKNE